MSVDDAVQPLGPAGAPYGAISVVIPCWNRADLLESVLGCIRAQVYPVAEILVVDDGSSEDLAPPADRFGARVIRNASNRGFAASVNRGLAEAKSDWILVINNDVQIPATWLSTMVAAAALARAPFACGKLVDAAQPERIDGTFDLVCRGGTAWRRGHGRTDGPEWSRPERVQFPPFTAVLIRRSMVQQVGALDERFGSYLEDVDWGARCAAQGLRGIYVPAAVGFHSGSETLGAWRNATVRLISRNQILFYCKQLRGAGSWHALVAQLLWVGLAARHGRLWSALLGKVDGLRHLRTWTAEPSAWASIREAVQESERILESAQEESGIETYWRLYFRLTGRTCNPSRRSS